MPERARRNRVYHRLAFPALGVKRTDCDDALWLRLLLIDRNSELQSRCVRTPAPRALGGGRGFGPGQVYAPGSDRRPSRTTPSPALAEQARSGEISRTVA